MSAPVEIPRDATVEDDGDMMFRANWIRQVLQKKLVLVHADRVRVVDPPPETPTELQEIDVL